MAMINAWADGTKPWSYPEVEKAVRDVAFLRMQLLPYIYSTFAQYHFYGIPPFRAMNLVEGFAFQSNAIKDSLDASRNPYAMSIGQDIKDQYMMGDNLLVAPMFAGQSARKVYLPEGKWYDFYTGKLAGGNQVIEVNLGIDKIPLFVKDGGIIPMIPERRTAPSLGEKLQLIVRHYGESEGNYMLYDDDGVSFNYEKGIFSLSKLIVHRDKYGKLNGSVSKLSPGKPFGYKDEIKWEFMTE
jgi:alpha-D-xyloside xylohydrolase